MSKIQAESITAEVVTTIVAETMRSTTTVEKGPLITQVTTVMTHKRRGKEGTTTEPACKIPNTTELHEMALAVGTVIEVTELAENLQLRGLTRTV